MNIMKTPSTKILFSLLALFIVMALPMFAVAQDTLPVDPDSVPIDGGLSLLVVAGVGYGAKKLKEKRKK
jgi:hypothetical protein